MVGENTLFTSENGHEAPTSDRCRQAVHALRGYAYQITAAALEWLDLGERTILFLEVAEDYATVVANSLNAVQVKDTEASSVTLNSKNVRDAVHNFVDLTFRNPSMDVHLTFFTSSPVAAEKNISDYHFPKPGLLYWRKLAKGGDISPLRKLLTSDKYSREVQEFVNSRNDDELRTDMLQKIHWECGKPDYAALKNEFSERLTVVGRETFKLSSHLCEKIEPVILYHVLQSSLAKSPAQRSLNRALLYRCIDDASRISIGWNDFENLLNIQQRNDGLNPAPATPDWISEAYEAPSNERLLPRLQLIEEALQKISSTGVCVIFGSSGVGKSHVSHCVAGQSGDPFHVIDFREIHGDEAVSRIKVLLSRIGAMSKQNMILEDFNCLHEPRIATYIAELFSAVDRRDIKLILTCYEVPANAVLVKTGIHSACVMACSYLTPEESAQLVKLHGGNSELWGKLAHVSGENGHPQLVHAFISGMALRNWPSSEIVDVLKNGVSSNDIKEERESIRRYVIKRLPDPEREMLYRLSLITGSFTRDAATKLGATPPPLRLPGELFDTLKGPWVESLENNLFRISPLAAKSGKEILTPAQQMILHKEIAMHFFRGGAGVDVQDIDKIITHAMAGKNELILTALSFNLLTAGEEIIHYLYNSVSLLRMLPLNSLAWPDNPTVSCALRIVQFKIRMFSRDKSQIKACWETLQAELKCINDSDPTRTFRAAALAGVLNTSGIASYIDNWIPLLVELHDMVEQSSETDLFDAFEADKMSSSEVIPLFFAVGVTGLSDFNILRNIIQSLNALAPGLRMYLLQFYQTLNPDFSVLVQTAWTERAASDVDQHTVQMYRDLASMTTQWNLPALTTQCWKAAAIITAQNLHDVPASLRILEDASFSGADPTMLSLARVKILWQDGQHKQVCEEMHSLAASAHGDNLVERTYLLRQAAISASHVEKWELAEQWFLLSQQSASGIELDNMQVLAAGLNADAAVAALKAGSTKRSLELISSALNQLESIDHQRSLNAYYCHQVVRHVVLWMCLNNDGPNTAAENSIVVVPGCCSNPSPSEAIRQKEHTPIMMAWYMLAELDIALGTQLGLIDKLTPRNENRYIIALETGLRKKLLMQAALDLHVVRFASAAYDFISCWHALEALRDSGRLQNVHPYANWEPIPPIGQEAAHNKIEVLNKLLISYFIVAACKNRPVNQEVLTQGIVHCFGQSVADACLLGDLRKGPGAGLDMLISIMYIGQGEMRSPLHYCIAGIHALIQARHSFNPRELVALIAKWQRYTWKLLLQWENLNAPGIFTALNRKHDDEIFLSRLLLEASKLTRANLSQYELNELQKVLDLDIDR